VAADPYRYFRVEARELLEQLGRGVLELEKASQPAEVVARLLRLAHTLKGAARVVKQRAIADAAHAIEDALAPLRGTAEPAHRGVVDAVLTLLDEASAGVAALGAAAEPAGAPARVAADEPLRTLRADAADIDALLDAVTEVQVQLATIRPSLDAADRARRAADLLVDELAPRAPAARPAGNGAAARARGRAEGLRDAIAALARGLTQGFERLDREVRQVRDAAERLRLVPAGAVLSALERVVRDAAQTARKRVAFEGRAGGVGLDAHVLGIVQTALVQIVRNAVAHGIEPEEARRAAGKPLDGRISIDVARRGNRVAFVCRDDGQGLDVEAIRRAAQRKGLVPADVQGVDPGELMRLLLKGGISTSGAVTEIAGRGVGLDIVRDAAERLGGDVRFATDAGKGTVVELVVPVSLASLDALVVEAGGVAAAIPLDAVRRTLRIGAGELVRAPDGDSIAYEGKVIPFVALDRPLARRGHEARRTEACSAVIVRDETALAAVGVDRLLGTASVVIRPLPGLAPADPIVAGAGLDAEGNPRLVLDAQALIARARAGEPSAPAGDRPRPRVLVIDDSLTTRMLERSILEAAGYEVDLAVSGEEALEKTRARGYALFLVDVEMPGMDGFAFVERARAEPALRVIPSILVTSRSSPEDRARGEAAGASGYIAKSEFDQTDLLERIRKLVG